MKKTNFLAIALSICCTNALYANTIILQEVSLSESTEIGTNSEVDMDKVEKIQAKSLKDVFKNEPSISVSGGGSSGTQKIFLRGIESTNLSVTLDGASQGVNMMQHRSNMSGIESDILKVVEVKTTPSAENRSALGGSIEMTTKDAQDFVVDGKSTGAIIRMNYASADDTDAGSTTLYSVFGNYYGIYANISAQNGGNYKVGGDGEEVLGTHAKDRDYFVKFSMLENNNQTLKVAFGKHTRSGLQEDDKGAPATTTVEATRNFSELVRDTFTVEHTYNPKNSIINLATNFYKNKTDEEIISRTTGVKTNNTRDDIGGKIKNTIVADFGVTHNTFVLGADYVKEDGSTSGKTIKYNAKNIGFFTQNTMAIDKFSFHYGARVDSYDTLIGPQTLSGTEVSPNTGIEYQFTEKINIFANYGEAIRATGIIPLSWLTNAGATTWTWSNIKPEISEQKEIGIKYTTNDIFTENDLFKISLAFFDTKIENLIKQIGGSQGSPVTGIQNSTSLLETKGLEVKASWQNEDWYASVGFTKANVTSDDADLVAGVGNRTGAASGDKFVLYTNYQLIPNISLGYLMTAVRGISYDNGTSKPGYTVHDVNAQWQPDFIKGGTIYLAVNNILDKRYIEQTTTSSTFLEPGRDIRVGLKYQF